MSQLTRFKKTSVIKWLENLISCDVLEWPVHELEIEELYENFQKSAPGNDCIFSQRRYFTYFFNMVIQERKNQDIVCREYLYPTYRVAYEFIHPDLFDSNEKEGMC